MARRVFLAAFLFMAVILSRQPLMATTLHVAIDGSDTNDGTSGSPFRTIQKGADEAQPGDTVKVHPGVYHEIVRINTSGQPGMPITFEGELDSNGEWLTIVDGGEPATGWVPAPEVGDGVFKTTAISFEPGCMVVEEDGTVKDIPKIHKEDTAFTYLAKPADATETTHSLNITINFWDGIEALYYYSGGTLFMRFRNGDDPNNKVIRVSGDGWAGYLFSLSNKSYINIKNFQLQCGRAGIVLAHPDTHHVIIEQNRIIATGRDKIYMEDNVHDIDVRNNIAYMSGLGSYTPGAWGGGTTYDAGVKEHIYYAYKYYISNSATSTQEDSGIRTSYVNGANVKIYNNEVFNSLSGVSIGDDSSNTEVYGNTISNISSGCFYIGRRSSAMIHDNLVYNCNINIRLGSVDLLGNGREVYYFNNKSYNPDGVGEHTFFHVSSASTVLSSYGKYYFYHNSFTGGKSVFVPSAWADDTGALKNTRWINNVLSPSTYMYTNGGRAFFDDPEMVEVFDYNWVGALYSYYGGNPVPAWAGANNIWAENQFMWDDSSMPDFILPADSAAREAGTDLSSMPGLAPGYFTGPAPHMGAVQDTDAVKPHAPLNLRIVE